MLKRGHHSPAWRVPELRLPWRYLPLEGVVYGPSAEAGVQRLTHTGGGVLFKADVSDKGARVCCRWSRLRSMRGG